mgnify:FL=1|tara:strand:+ start:10205 stop:10552 length:348 start_codon:yes stop_codon:yes gene_type:complete
MIREGEYGSLNLFYKDLFIGSYALSEKRTYERYKYQGEHLLIDTMKQNGFLNLERQEFTYTHFIDYIYERKSKKETIWRTDYELFLSCVFALIKLNILDEDDCVFIMPKKRLKNK